MRWRGREVVIRQVHQLTNSPQRLASEPDENVRKAIEVTIRELSNR